MGAQKNTKGAAAEGRRPLCSFCSATLFQRSRICSFQSNLFLHNRNLQRGAAAEGRRPYYAEAAAGPAAGAGAEAATGVATRAVARADVFTSVFTDVLTDAFTDVFTEAGGEEKNTAVNQLA